MLILTRRANEGISITDTATGRTVVVTVLKTGKTRVSVGISAAPEVRISRIGAPVISQSHPQLGSEEPIPHPSGGSA